jgi:hypothetical protein
MLFADLFCYLHEACLKLGSLDPLSHFHRCAIVLICVPGAPLRARCTRIWDLADQLRRIAEDLEEDPVEAGWILEGWGDWLTWDVAWAYFWQDLQ